VAGLAFDSHLEGGAGNDVWELFSAVQGSPAFRRGLHVLEDHRQARFFRAAAIGLAMSQSDSGETLVRLDLACY
jgi:hypothetical protein